MLGCKINFKNSVTLQYTNDKNPWEGQIRETSFTIASNNLKYFGVTLTKQIKDLCDKTSSLWRKKLEKISEDEMIFPING